MESPDDERARKRQQAIERWIQEAGVTEEETVVFCRKIALSFRRALMQHVGRHPARDVPFEPPLTIDSGKFDLDEAKKVQQFVGKLLAEYRQCTTLTGLTINVRMDWKTVQPQPQNPEAPSDLPVAEIIAVEELEKGTPPKPVSADSDPSLPALADDRSGDTDAP